MIHYGAPTPKRQYALSNSRHVSSLFAGKLRGWAQEKAARGLLESGKELVTKYVDKKGQRRWKGKKGTLKESERGA